MMGRLRIQRVSSAIRTPPILPHPGFLPHLRSFPTPPSIVSHTILDPSPILRSPISDHSPGLVQYNHYTGGADRGSRIGEPEGSDQRNLTLVTRVLAMSFGVGVGCACGAGARPGFMRCRCCMTLADSMTRVCYQPHTRHVIRQSSVRTLRCQ